MISEVEADKIDQWLRKFQKEHGDSMIVNDDIIRDLACSLYDDIPLGYEASHRLANWLFCHLNTPKIPEEHLKNIQYKVDLQENAAKRLYEALADYKRYTRDILDIAGLLYPDE